MHRVGDEPVLDADEVVAVSTEDGVGTTVAAEQVFRCIAREPVVASAIPLEATSDTTITALSSATRPVIPIFRSLVIPTSFLWKGREGHPPPLRSYFSLLFDGQAVIPTCAYGLDPAEGSPARRLHPDRRIGGVVGPIS